MVENLWVNYLQMQLATKKREPFLLPFFDANLA